MPYEFEFMKDSIDLPSESAGDARAQGEVRLFDGSVWRVVKWQGSLDEAARVESLRVGCLEFYSNGEPIQPRGQLLCH